MYAVIATGGKQYKAEIGKCLKVSKLEQNIGEGIEFDKVLLVDDGEHVTIGSPYVAGVKVSAEILQQDRTPKVAIVKFKRRKHHLRQGTHRQHFTQVKIKDIQLVK